jgi:hypothetical protein
MPDPTPPTPPAAPEQPPPHHRHHHRHIFWRRVRVYSLSLLLVGSIYFYAAARIMREHPQRVTSEILSRLPFPSSVGRVQWLNASQLDLRDLKVGDFFYAAHVIVTATPYELLRHHIDEIDIRGAQFFTGKFNDALRRGGKSKGPGGLDWTITKLVIYRGTLLLEEMAPDMPAIPVRLGIKQPITLNYVKLGHPDRSPSMTRERTVDLENVLIVSPFDALSPVLSLPLIRVTFTYNELWQHHLRQVCVVQPVLHLGQDLFWFTDQFKKEHAAAPHSGKGVDAPWQLDHFQVRYGQLAVNAFGQPAFQFPFFFDTDVDDVRLDQLDKVTARMVVPIEKFNADYTDYKIKIVDLTGQLEFSIPPGTQANNVFPKIIIKELSWNGIAATDVTTWVTFDPSGIYGKLTGTCERGQLAGNFEIYYLKGFTWNADFFANTIDCAPIADKLAGKYGTLTGTIDGQIGVQGKTTEITACTGRLDLRKAGLLQIRSADDLIKRLPGAKGSLQNQALKLAVGALRNYPYQVGGVKINYTPEGGVASLHLDGPSGKRDFSVYLHPYEGTSNVAKAGDSQ